MRVFAVLVLELLGDFIINRLNEYIHKNAYFILLDGKCTGTRLFFMSRTRVRQ